MKLRSASDQDIRPEWPLHSGLSATAQSPALHLRTTPSERFLLFTTGILFPLESHIPSVAGFSSLFVVFAVLAVYVTIARAWSFDKVWMHPVFVAAYVFIGISIALESVNPLSSYQVIGRFALMIGGALLVASLCRDRAALKMFLYGHIGAALWLGPLLMLTSYGTLSGVVATNYNEASQARVEAFKDVPIAGNLNAFAMTCAKGGIVALAFALGSASLPGRKVFALIGAFCLVASSLAMSRSAMLIALVACAVMLKAHGMRKGRVWLLVGLIAASAVFVVPGAIWSRMVVATGQSKELRVNFYENAIRDVDDYWFMGVGEGNYYKKWGFEHGYAHIDGDTFVVYGVHNALLQVLIQWGVIDLLAFLAIFLQAYRCIPTRCGSDPLALSVLGLAISLFLHLPFTSGIEGKGFSLGLGMLVAYQSWLAQGSGPQPVGRESSLPQLPFADNS